MAKIMQNQKEKKEYTVAEVVEMLTDHFAIEDKTTLRGIESEALPKSTLQVRAIKYLRQFNIQKDIVNKAISEYKDSIFGYGQLEKLVNDPEVTDIAIYGPGPVWVKKHGRHEMSDVSFETPEQVSAFIDNIANKLHLNISSIEALSTRTDKKTNKDVILRVSIVSKLVTSSECHNMHIRKVQKSKVGLDRLVELEMIDDRLKEYLTNAAKTSPGMIFTGRGASGKTTLLNALLDEIDPASSVSIIQENEELFSDVHQATYLWHVVTAAGEGRTSYSLQDLARQGLLMDLDYFIIGEVKGAEARYIVTAANTGTTCWCTVHGNNSREALAKLADYIKSHQDYTNVPAQDIIPFLTSLRTVVFIKKFKVQEISEVVGCDRESNRLLYKQIYDRAHVEDPWFDHSPRLDETPRG